jgi:hypothetical protein
VRSSTLPALERFVALVADAPFDADPLVADPFDAEPPDDGVLDDRRFDPVPDPDDADVAAFGDAPVERFDVERFLDGPQVLMARTNVPRGCPPTPRPSPPAPSDAHPGCSQR